MGFNVVSDSITAWLTRMAEQYHTPGLATHLVTALHRPLRKELASQERPDNLVRLEKLPFGAPGWLRQSFYEGDPLYMFEPEGRMRDDIRHIADWIAADIMNEASWLRQCDEKRRPRKLLKLGSLEQAVSEADKAMVVEASRARTLIETQGHMEVVKTFPDGVQVVRLLTPEALDDDSARMHHCIGKGSYDRFLAGDRQYFSLRTPVSAQFPKGRAFVTMEVDMLAERPVLLQSKGRQNRPPVSKYFPYVREFVSEQGYKLHENPAMTGMVEQNGVYYDICNLPENFHWRGDLDLSYTFITHLPDGLSVDGRVDIQYTAVSRLPARLKVGGGLTAHNTRIRTLTCEDTAGIRGGIFMGDNMLDFLPDEWVVDGDLYLVGSNILAFPKNLTVTRNLNLFRASFPGFAEGLKVWGSVTTDGIRPLPDAEINGRIITDPAASVQAQEWTKRQFESRFSPD